MMKPFIFDAHLDLAMNAMEWNRDLRWSISDIRNSEHGMNDKPDRANGTVSFPALRDGNIGMVVATLIARYVKPTSNLPGWNSPEQAWAQTQGQMAWYSAMEAAGVLRQIKDLASLETHLAQWKKEPESTPIGYMLSLEGADSIISFEHVEMAYQQGLRAIGPAHYGPGTFAQGTDATGGIGAKGRALLAEMESLDMILDATHLCDESFWEALSCFNGPVWASHNNARAMVNHNRQFDDEQLKALFERDAVIGIPLDAWMMVPNWVRGESTPESMDVSLETMANHIDYICQLAGSSKHVMIGTDLDGAFGTEQCPKDLDTIADLQKLPAILSSRGYSQEDIQGILSLNGLNFLRRAWS
jgi:membrane dipeptidase